MKTSCMNEQITTTLHNYDLSPAQLKDEKVKTLKLTDSTSPIN